MKREPKMNDPSPEVRLEAARKSLEAIFKLTLVNAASETRQNLEALVDKCNHEAQCGLRSSEDPVLTRMTVGAANFGRFGYDPTP